MLHRSTVLALAAAPLLLACRGGDAQCVVGADCASGACDVNGRCVAVISPEGGAHDGGGSSGGDDGGSRDGADAIDATFGEGGIQGCSPNHDGTITRDEVPMQAGLRATFLVAENVTWSTAGTNDAGGDRAWDLTGALSGDHPALFDTESPSGAWWEGDYAGATYASKLSDTQTLLGIFQAGTSSLSLLGVVSPQSGVQQTKLAYSPIVPTLQLPISVGTTWSVSSNVSGTAQGVPGIYTEQYDNKVDAAGTMKTPFGTFDVLRVSTVLTRTAGPTITIYRSYAWMAECFGAVANVSSQADETSAEFSNVAEVRRLTP